MKIPSLHSMKKSCDGYTKIANNYWKALLLKKRQSFFLFFTKRWKRKKVKTEIHKFGVLNGR